MYKPIWAKGDHEKAYRNWPVHVDDQPLLATLVWEKAHQCFRVFVHLALPVGAIAAVWHYTRLSQGVCGILRRLFAIPQMAYVDDFLRCVPKCYAAICEDAFQRVHRILGIPLKQGKDKVAARVEALGGNW